MQRVWGDIHPRRPTAGSHSRCVNPRRDILTKGIYLSVVFARVPLCFRDDIFGNVTALWFSSRADRFVPLPEHYDNRT